MGASLKIDFVGEGHYWIAWRKDLCIDCFVGEGLGYKCVYVCICVCACISMCVCIYVYMCMYMCMHMHVCMYKCVCMYMRVCMCVYVR